jgi:tetratricopeptide (TPR) repeat protein
MIEDSGRTFKPVSRDSVIFGVAGVFFGILVGWIIGSQQGGAPRLAAQPAAAPAATSGQGSTAAPLDEARASALANAAEKNPRDVQARLDLGNLYFDSERFEDAARWYEQALAIEPGNVGASTDLGISYYYMNQPDKALQQFDRSLAIDSRHTKTLLNVGIVRAFGKDDLAGAAEAWQRVVEYAPDSPEGKRAQQALDSLRNAHPNLQGGSATTAKPPGAPD